MFKLRNSTSSAGTPTFTFDINNSTKYDFKFWWWSNILIEYYKSYGGKVINNRSCYASNSSVDIEQGNLNV